jgi:hypothetical protein
MARLSTGLRNALVNSFGLGSMMNAGIIRVYGGVLPTTPDNPPNTLELGRITTEGKVWLPGDLSTGAGLLLAFSPPGALVNLGEWRLKGLTTGTAVWYRWNWMDADNGQFSLTLPRIDGRVGSELVLGSPLITASTNRTIESFAFVLGLGD